MPLVHGGSVILALVERYCGVETSTTSGPRHLLARIDERTIDGGDLAGDGGPIRLEDELAVEGWHGFDDRVEVHPHRPLFPPSILHHAHEQRPLRRVDEVLAGEPGASHARLAGASLGKTLHARCVKPVRQEAIGVGDGEVRRLRQPALLCDTLEIVEERLAAGDIAALVEVGLPGSKASPSSCIAASISRTPSSSPLESLRRPRMKSADACSRRCWSTASSHGIACAGPSASSRRNAYRNRPSASRRPAAAPAANSAI